MYFMITNFINLIVQILKGTCQGVDTNAMVPCRVRAARPMRHIKAPWRK